MRTITFYSYKGGVGRTLTVANVAKHMASLGKKVFLIDFDLEAPGLPYKLGGEGGALAPERGLVDILVAFTKTRRLPEPLADYVVEVESAELPRKAVHFLPAGSAPSAGYWKSLAQIDWHALFYAEEPEGIPLFLELKAFVEETYAPDFLLIDARTGITEMGGVATTVLPDHVVCMLLPTREQIDGTRGVMHAIRAAPRMEGAAQVELLAVLSRMPRRGEDAESAEVERVKALLNAPTDDLGTSLRLDDIPVLHREPALEEREVILVGRSRSPKDEESLLLGDYGRLFGKLFPLHTAPAQPSAAQEVPLSKLAPDDLQALVRSAVDGNQGALRRLVTGLLPVVQSAVAGTLFRQRGSKRYQHADVEDFTEAALVMLLDNRARALGGWDPSGASISLVSWPWACAA